MEKKEASVKEGWMPYIRVYTMLSSEFSKSLYWRRNGFERSVCKGPYQTPK